MTGAALMGLKIARTAVMIIPSASRIRLDASSFPGWKATSALIGIAPGRSIIQESRVHPGVPSPTPHVYFVQPKRSICLPARDNELASAL